MIRIDGTPPRFAPIISLGFLLVALGCLEDTPSPTAPAHQPAVAAATTAELSFYQLTSGVYHTCGVTTDFQAYCWGYNGDAQLGGGPSTSGTTDSPHPVYGGLTFKQIDAGGYHTCAVTPDNRAYCWGRGGQLGDGTTATTGTLVAVAGNHSFRQVSGGRQHSCAVATDNRAYCWGDNSHGQLGDGTTTTRLKPVAVLGGLFFRQVSAGGDHTCGVTTDDRAYCWGYSRYGQVGDSTNGWTRLKPVRVRSQQQFRTVDAGLEHTCGATLSDRAYCWGRNQAGQLGDGTLSQRRWPKAVAGGLSFSRVTAGQAHTCGEGGGGRAYCWGGNGSGGLGDGTQTNRSKPVAVAGGLVFKQLSAGLLNRTCGKTDASVGYCWGDNTFYALGDGNSANTEEMNRLTPNRIAAPY